MLCHVIVKLSVMDLQTQCKKQQEIITHWREYFVNSSRKLRSTMAPYLVSSNLIQGGIKTISTFYFDNPITGSLSECDRAKQICTGTPGAACWVRTEWELRLPLSPSVVRQRVGPCCLRHAYCRAATPALEIIITHQHGLTHGDRRTWHT